MLIVSDNVEMLATSVPMDSTEMVENASKSLKLATNLTIKTIPATHAIKDTTLIGTISAKKLTFYANHLTRGATV